MKNKNILEIYSDDLLTSFSQVTATGLSKMLDGDLSHDQITRFLSEKSYDSKDLWREVKSSVRKIEENDGVLILDDTVQEKTYSKVNDLICWHYDHNVNRSVKGLNMLNCIYSANDIDIPVSYETHRKAFAMRYKNPKKGEKKFKNKK
jgi:hypothetical protein